MPLSGKGVLAAMIGFFFGFVLQRSGASDYDKLTGMVSLKDLDLLKLMMTAIGVAAVGFYALAAAGVRHFTVKPLKVLAMSIGGILFGIGFALNGYCPGTGLVGLAEGKKDALIAVIGGMIGSLAYAYSKPVLDRYLETPDYGDVTIDRVTKTSPLPTAIVFGISMILLTFALDVAGGILRGKR